MQFKASKIRLQTNEEGQCEIILTTKENPLKIRQEVLEKKEIIAKGKELAVEVKQHREKRSLDANGYLWVICQKIAEALRGKHTKENIYKKAIREVGQFEIVPIKDEAVERWLECWDSKGIGWFAEVIHDSKLPGYKNVRSYYGSSVYDTREMSILIDYIVEEAKELNIETMPPTELESLKAAWGDNRKVG